MFTKTNVAGTNDTMTIVTVHNFLSRVYVPNSMPVLHLLLVDFGSYPSPPWLTSFYDQDLMITTRFEWWLVTV